MKVKYNGKLTKSHESDIGWDLYASEDITIDCYDGAVIHTDLSLEMDGVFALVLPRSGLSTGGLVCSTGVIDPNYRGEILVSIENHTDEDYPIKKGDRIAQLVFLPIPAVELIQVTSTSKDTDRAEKGFGSSGR